MDPQREQDLVIVCRSYSERECAELELVLTARGIAYRRVPGARGERLLAVPSAQASAAADELEAYRTEHAQRPAAPAPRREFTGAWAGVAAYAGAIMLVAVLARQLVFGVDWVGAGGLVAGRVVGGEWWRAVTALTLHVDVAHLAGNLAFGGFFGYFIGRYFGPGIGWSAILGAGFAGNVLNALIQADTHRSIGASTAVFGALGLLTAHAWLRGREQTSRRARFAPIAAGIGLLAFTGTGGENTDIFAHLTGFVAGFGIGALLDRVELPQSQRAQLLFGAGALGVLALAWLTALGAAR